MTMVDRTSRTGLALATILAVALGIATMALPPLVAEWSSPSGLTVARLPDTVSAGFTRWMSSATSAPAAPLSDAVTFWAVFHVAKVVLAIALLSALVIVGRRVWGRATSAETRTARAGWTAAGVLGAGLPVLALLVVLANIQGAVAPLSSVMSFLPVGTSPAAAQVRAELATGDYGPVTITLIADFRLYHAALVGCLAVVLAGLGAAIVVMLVRRARMPRAAVVPRRLLTFGTAALLLLCAALGLTLLANLSTVADTAPALSGFFGTGAS